MFNIFEKKAQARSFNFNEAYQFLKQEQKAAMFQAIAIFKSATTEEGRNAAWSALTDAAKDVLLEEKLPTDLKTVQEFIGEFSKIPNQSNYTEAIATVSENEAQIETSLQNDESTEINSDVRVTPRRFPAPEPVAPATIITPNIISAQQRGLGVTVNPELGQDDGDAMMARLIAEAQAAPFEPKSEVYISPYGGDAPRHVVPSDEEIVEALARENSQVPRHEGTIPERPSQHL